MGSSLSPIASMILNLCPTKRFTPGGMLCLGLLPTKSALTDTNVLFTAILKRMEQDGCFRGFIVHDAFQEKERPVRIEFALFIEDLKGLPMLLCCRTGPCKVGGCPWCEHIGISMAASARYFTAIVLLPTNDPLRDLFEVEFGAHTGIRSFFIRPSFVLYSYPV
jgi:hypothetical protein